MAITVFGLESVGIDAEEELGSMRTQFSLLIKTGNWQRAARRAGDGNEHLARSAWTYALRFAPMYSFVAIRDIFLMPPFYTQCPVFGKRGRLNPCPTSRRASTIMATCGLHMAASGELTSGTEYGTILIKTVKESVYASDDGFGGP